MEMHTCDLLAKIIHRDVHPLALWEGCHTKLFCLDQTCSAMKQMVRNSWHALHNPQSLSFRLQASRLKPKGYSPTTFPGFRALNKPNLTYHVSGVLRA